MNLLSVPNANCEMPIIGGGKLKLVAFQPNIYLAAKSRALHPVYLWPLIARSPNTPAQPPTTHHPQANRAATTHNRLISCRLSAGIPMGLFLEECIRLWGNSPSVNIVAHEIHTSSISISHLLESSAASCRTPAYPGSLRPSFSRGCHSDKGPPR